MLLHYVNCTRFSHMCCPNFLCVSPGSRKVFLLWDYMLVWGFPWCMSGGPFPRHHYYNVHFRNQQNKQHSYHNIRLVCFVGYLIIPTCVLR